MWSRAEWVKSEKDIMLLNDVPLRTRRVLSLYKVYGNSALLVLNRTSMNSVNTLLALSRQYEESKESKTENIGQINCPPRNGNMAIIRRNCDLLWDSISVLSFKYQPEQTIRAKTLGYSTR